MALVVAVLVASGGCTSRPLAPRRVTWMVGSALPGFDPDGPPQPVRHALERLLTRALVECDSSGRVVADAAERWEYAPDSLTLTFTLRAGLRFTDGAACSSAHFRRALEAGLARSDHASGRWVLGSVRGVSALRNGKPMPVLGIECPDARRLVLRLEHRDRGLLDRLAAPGGCAAWKDRAPDVSWQHAVGLGPMRLIAGNEPLRMSLVSAGGDATIDTLVVRFTSGAPRVRSALRAGSVDAVWPLPPALLDEPIPSGYERRVWRSAPARQLVLVMRADLPPTTRAAARRALALGVNRADVLRGLGSAGRDAERHPGVLKFMLPRFDTRQIPLWLDRGKLGRSFHVTMAYDADGEAANVARRLQGEWSRAGLYIDLMPLRGSALEREALHGTQSHLLLLDWAPPVDDLRAALAMLVMPVRGPAVAGFRSGWRTREFDPWLAMDGSGPRFDPDLAASRLQQELVAFPLATLDRVAVVRAGLAMASFDPANGLDFRPFVAPAPRAP